MTVALAFPAVAVPMVGAPGAAAGVTLFDATEEALAPLALVALMTNAYAVPLVRPVTVIDVQGAEQVPVLLPNAEVAV